MSSPAPSPSSTSCSTADFTRFPTSDIACAVGSTQALASNTSSILSSCCKSAPVESFNNNCGYYCLSVQQSVADLQKCFMDGGINPSTIFCNGNNTATATVKPSASASASVSGSVSGSRTAGAPSGTGSAATSGSAGAAPGAIAPKGVSKAGLGMLGMIVVSVFAGAML